ncbi:MAG: RNA polymerase sigma factor, partial [Acidobacteriota bacterium]
FAKAYQNLNRLSDPGRFSSWVYRIALNECRMRFRKEKKRHALPYEEYVKSGRAEVETATPESALASKEIARVLVRAFEELPEEQRAVIVMKEYQELKFREIASILEVPLSTVKSRMYLGLKTLRRLMERRV